MRIVVYWKVQGTHVHCRVFVGGTKAGDLAFTVEEWMTAQDLLFGDAFIRKEPEEWPACPRCLEGELYCPEIHAEHSPACELWCYVCGRRISTAQEVFEGRADDEQSA